MPVTFLAPNRVGAGNIHGAGASDRVMGKVLISVAGLLFAAVPGEAHEPRGWLDTQVAWHDNVTNAERSEDLLPALEWRTELRAGIQRALPGGHRAGATAGLRTEIWPRFQGLDAVVPGVAMSWEFKPGLGPYRPRFQADWEGEWVGARERDRGGWGNAGRLMVRQRAGPAWLFTAGHEWRRFAARGRAFDRQGREWFAQAQWSFSPTWLVGAEIRRRVGDVVSYSRPPRPDLAAIGKPLTFVDTFEQAEPWLAYYFRAESRSGSLELQRTFRRLALSLRHEYRHTLHAGPGYKNHLTTVRLVREF
ncbi:MAG: hypothetical protein PSV13_13995 [Lacunisphaera sp.]|nr:hypothetical protein [Lacunisphaera sp.]